MEDRAIEPRNYGINRHSTLPYDFDLETNDQNLKFLRHYAAGSRRLTDRFSVRFELGDQVVAAILHSLPNVAKITRKI